MKVCVCVGSSCFLKGAYEVIKKFQQLEITTNESLDLCGRFCNDQCMDGVVITIDEVLYTQVSAEDVEGLIKKHKQGG